MNNPFDYYLHVLTHYAEFSGRARRSEYWYFALFNFLILVGINVALRITAGPVLASVVYMLYNLGVTIPSLAVGVRRIHDTGRSGWYMLIPFYNLVLLVTHGVPGPNRYGPDPKAPSGVALQQTPGS